MSYFDDFIEDVEAGRQGRNIGLSTGSKKLDNALGGVQRGTYYLIGGNTGTGKTAFADHAFVLSPYENYLHNIIGERHSDKPLIKLRVFIIQWRLQHVRRLLSGYVIYYIGDINLL